MPGIVVIAYGSPAELEFLQFFTSTRPPGFVTRTISRSARGWRRNPRNG
jgi:hypothetical protein